MSDGTGPTEGSLETTAQRSALMKRVRRKDTEPELAVRTLLWSTGARYRVNVDGLPGTPDIVNKSRKKALFVHGCFWHFHQDCPRGTLPDRNRDYWRVKFEKNKERDRRKTKDLEDRGFDVLVVWECELDQPETLRQRLQSFWYDDA